MTEKIYLQNPYLREIKGRIIDKKYINNKYYIILNRTIFFPNLVSGQPRDKGTINGIEVIDVFEEDGKIIHVLQDNIYNDNVHLAIDWDNRFDIMQQHTGQHLLSSVFYKLYGAETIGFYIGHDHVYIDINLKEINSEIIKRVENFTNKIIFSNFDIKTYVIGKNNLDNIPINKLPNNNSNIRIVEIDGIDFTPCYGTHHRSTGEIGLIKIKNWTKYKESIRIEFVCGYRALEDYSNKAIEIEQLKKENHLLKKELERYKKT